MAIMGQLGAMVSNCPHAGNQADKRTSIWNITGPTGKWKERLWCIMHWHLKLSLRSHVQSLLLTSLARTNYMTIPDVKTWKENEKLLQIALMMTSGILFSVSSYLGTLILWWQTYVDSVHICPYYLAEKRQKFPHILSYFSIALGTPKDHVSWELRGKNVTDPSWVPEKVHLKIVGGKWSWRSCFNKKGQSQIWSKLSTVFENQIPRGQCSKIKSFTY